MTKQATITSLGSLANQTTAVNTINTNTTNLNAALLNTLSLDGSSPNQMTVSLDMNQNQIINLPAPLTAASPVRLTDITTSGVIPVLVTLTTFGNSLVNAVNAGAANTLLGLSTVATTGAYSSLTGTPAISAFGTTLINEANAGAANTLLGISTIGTSGHYQDATGNLVPSAGTTSIAPLAFTSGTNLTSATAGAVEYDGTCFYGTPLSGQRGIIPASMYSVNTTALTLANVNTAQAVLNSTTNGAITLPASTNFFFEGMYYLTTTGVTSHAYDMLFGGTATFNTFMYTYVSSGNAGTTLCGVVTSLTGQALDPPASSGDAGSVFFSGFLSVNAGGTLIPQMKFSAAPGATGLSNIGTYFKLYPVKNNFAGNWS